MEHQGVGIRKILLALIIFGCLAKIPAPENHINKQTQQIAPIAAEVKTVSQTQERPVEAVKPTPEPEVVVTPPPAPPVELPKSKTDLMNLAGIPASEQQAVDYIVSKESGWRECVSNGGLVDCEYTGNKAYGLCQALPKEKMASAGGDYMTNPVTQLKWCHTYANDRYQGWWKAHAFWLANAWW